MKHHTTDETTVSDTVHRSLSKQAAHLIADHSGDAEAETFFDLVFTYVRSSLVRKDLGASFHDTYDDADYDTITGTGLRQETGDSIGDLDAGDLLPALVQSSSSMNSHQYER